MLIKLISGFSEDERRGYANIKEANLRTDKEFNCRVDKDWFNLTFIYPLQDRRLISEFLAVQQEIRNILRDEAGVHYYQTDRDFHMSLLSQTEVDFLPENERRPFRADALTLMSGARDLFVAPKIHFLGGCSTQNAVILHGYHFAELNRSRKEIADYGLRQKLFHPRLAQNIANGRIYPNIAHLSLILFREPVALALHRKINDVLNDLYFTGEPTLFSELGLYEFHKFGMFSKSEKLDSLSLALP